MSMPERRLEPAALRTFIATALVGAGARQTDADAVATHLVDANLKGHDSHGAGRLPAYVDQARRELINLQASPR